MKPLISVIVPVYNVEKYLEKSLDTIIEQTYDNIEIIVVNDGSTDGSGKICDRYAKKDIRIKVIHQENKGLSGARNSALEVASGDYITCIDSDDFIAETMIEELLTGIVNAKADISSCGFIYCDELNNTLREEIIEETKIIEGKNQLKSLLSCSEITTTAWGKLYKRELFKNVRYPLGKYNEDVFTTYKLLAKSKKTVVINRGLYYYRQVTGSIMNSKFSTKHLDGIEATIERAVFVKQNYPEFFNYANATVVYACCKNYERMIKANYSDMVIEDKIQLTIRQRIFSFLFFSDAAIKTKVFAITCCLNMKLARKIYIEIMKR